MHAIVWANTVHATRSIETCAAQQAGLRLNKDFAASDGSTTGELWITEHHNALCQALSARLPKVPAVTFLD